MLVCINREILGSDRHLQLNSETKAIKWVVSKDTSDFSWGFKKGKDLSHISKLFNVKVEDSPDEKYLKLFRKDMGISSSIPLHNILPSGVYKKYIQKLSNDLCDLLNTPNVDTYGNQSLLNREFLDSLEPTRSDNDLIDKITSTLYGPMPQLESFRTNNDNHSKKVSYDMFATKTGRLTVKSGPQILTLKKSHRQIIKSRYKDGIIKQIDYTSLEPRVALAITGQSPQKDIYTDVAKIVFDGEVTRKIAKLATISFLYGMGKRKMSEVINRSGYLLDDIIVRLEEYFGLHDVVGDLEAQQKNNAGIKNYFGRFIEEVDQPRHKLYNHYIQSTDVDVALTGFRQITDNIKEKNLRLTPIFVLHDALIIDCHPDDIRHLEDIKNHGMDIEGFDTEFYLDVEDLQ